jgi:microcystin-dependent protein
MRRFSAALLLLPALALAQAQTSFQTIGYQGLLRRSNGAPETQNVQITFSVFDALTGGNHLWSEQQSVTPNSGGFYAVFLGAQTGFPPSLFDGADRWLELHVQGDATPLAPRQQIASVAYALMAREVVGGIPIGALLPYAGTAAPPRFLLCNGAAVSRTTYAALFAVIGTTYGAGDGSTTFNLPDLQGRTPVGAGPGAGLTNRAVAAKGGEESHVLTVGEMPAHSHVDNGHAHGASGHSHGVYDPGHRHSPAVAWGSTYLGDGSQRYSGGGGDYWGNGGNAFSTATATTGISLHAAADTIQSGNANLANTGGGAAHNNMQPFLTVNYIMRAQ